MTAQYVEKVFHVIGWFTIAAMFALGIHFAVVAWRRRRKEEANRLEWESIQRQIREARSPEEKKAATERYLERLKRVS